MELEIAWKILIAVAAPTFFSVLVVVFHLVQADWERERERQWWAKRDATWIDGGAK
jgi:hypothetical protein